MARQDIANMLTGMGGGSTRPNPNMSSSDWRMAFGAQQAQGLMNAAGTTTPQEAIQMGIGKLDLESVKGLQTLAQMQQIRGDLKGAAQTVSQIKAIEARKVEETRYQEKLALDKRAATSDELRASASTAEGGGAIGKLNAQFYLPDSIAKFNENLRATGLKDYSLLERVDPVKEAYQVGVIGDIRAANKKRNEAFSSASGLRGKLDTMQEILDTGLQTGALAGLSKTAKGLVQSLFPDTPLEGLAEAEVFTALSNQLALLIRNPESGMGLPGATSNADLIFLKDSVPGLQKSPEGNKMLIEVYRKTYKFQKSMVQEQARLISANGGVPPLDMEARMLEFVDAQDILGDELREKLKAGGGKDYNKERLALEIAEAKAARSASSASASDKKTGKRTIQTK